jgi:hypothetical protein
VSIDSYLDDVSRRLTSAGFHSAEGPSQTSAYFRHAKARAVDVDTLVVARAASAATSVELRAASEAAVSFAKSYVERIPHERKARVIVFSLVVAQSTEAACQDFIATYRPKHWMLEEFPVLVDLSARSVSFYNRRVIWGAAYLASHRREAIELFAIR